VRIGELAQRIGVSTDTVRFYERAGWLPRPERQANAYREYAEADVEHFRLLIDLRRLEIPLEDASRGAMPATVAIRPPSCRRSLRGNARRLPSRWPACAPWMPGSRRCSDTSRVRGRLGTS
jgi:hypothetical protein